MRKLRVCLFLFLAFCLFGGNVHAKEYAPCTGVWEGSCFFSDIVIHLEQKGEKLEGVVYVYTAGEKTPYHVRGTVQGGRIKAAHHSGHTFVGKMLSDNEAEGIITTAKNKYTVKLKAHRRRK